MVEWSVATPRNPDEKILLRGDYGALVIWLGYGLKNGKNMAYWRAYNKDSGECLTLELNCYDTFLIAANQAELFAVSYIPA